MSLLQLLLLQVLICRGNEAAAEWGRGVWRLHVCNDDVTLRKQWKGEKMGDRDPK